jgi:toxin ParE1/3/4
MVRLIWTDEALDGLNQIAEYIAVSNPQAAKKLVQTVFEKVSRVERFPESGRVPLELSESRYREVVVSPCRVFYKIDGDQVFVLYVFREERELKRFLLQTGGS